MKTLEIELEGMHCEGCAETIQALLKLESGVQTLAVSFKEKHARVLYDPARTDSRRLIAAIEKAGYTAKASP